MSVVVELYGRLREQAVRGEVRCVRSPEVSQNSGATCSDLVRCVAPTSEHRRQTFD